MSSEPKKPQTGAASSDADSESGNQAEATRQALYALDVMRQRGLIDPETYEKRRAALLAAEEPGPA